jgi:hypothetical protein
MSYASQRSGLKTDSENIVILVLVAFDAVKVDLRCMFASVTPCRMYNKRKISSCAQTGKRSQSMRPAYSKLMHRLARNKIAFSVLLHRQC